MARDTMNGHGDDDGAGDEQQLPEGCARNGK